MTYPKDIIFSSHISSDSDLCLVIMPFDSGFDPVYECIKKAVESPEIGMRCVRGDEISSTKSVMTDVLDLILRANIIIADLTNFNPNVMYEIGISHTVKDKVILLTQEIDNLPFDFKHLRAVSYTNDISGGFNLVHQLQTLISDIRSRPEIDINDRISNASIPTPTDIEVLHGPVRCLEKLVQELKTTKEKHGDQTAIIRALPVEFTPAIFGMRTNDSIDKLLNEYKVLIKNIILEGTVGVDNWDYTIYGRVYNPELNQATLDFIKEVYFTANTIPDTSEIGVDLTWNHTGFYVLGSTHQGIAEFVPESTFLFFGEPVSLRPESGCVIKNDEFSSLVIRRWFETLRKKAVNKGMYWNLLNDLSEPNAMNGIKEKVSIAILEG